MAYIVDQYFKITSRELQSADLTPYNIVYTVSVFSVVRRSHKKKTYFFNKYIFRQFSSHFLLFVVYLILNLLSIT